jgi:hypothetical protein
MQTELYYLRGISYQNLKDYMLSNEDLRKARSMGYKSIEIERRIAENN